MNLTSNSTILEYFYKEINETIYINCEFDNIWICIMIFTRLLVNNGNIQQLIYDLGISYLYIVKCLKIGFWIIGT